MLLNLSNKNIDREKWDECLRKSPNKLIYAESVYLDTIAEGWEAIILNDYEAIMPLIWRKKWGIKYLYQPAFFQQGGVFSAHEISHDLLHEFICKAAESFRFAEITLNYAHTIFTEKSFYAYSLRNNYLVQLGMGYKNIFQDYVPYIKQRLSWLSKFNLEYRHTKNYTRAIELYKKLYQYKMSSIKDKEYVQFQKICNHYDTKDRIIVREIFEKEGNELLAVAVLLKDENRLYNIVSCILPKGKKLLANYFLYDKIIHEFSNENILLDFEGSDVEGIAYFYEKFSTENQPYPFLKFNRLPALIKLFKH